MSATGEFFHFTDNPLADPERAKIFECGHVPMGKSELAGVHITEVELRELIGAVLHAELRGSVGIFAAVKL